MENMFAGLKLRRKMQYDHLQPREKVNVMPKLPIGGQQNLGVDESGKWARAQAKEKSVAHEAVRRNITAFIVCFSASEAIPNSIYVAVLQR